MDVPEAVRYDLSPMAVVVSSKGRRWYDFVTSVCAIVGGTFTVLGSGRRHAKDHEGRQAVEGIPGCFLKFTAFLASASSRASAGDSFRKLALALSHRALF